MAELVEIQVGIEALAGQSEKEAVRTARDLLALMGYEAGAWEGDDNGPYGNVYVGLLAVENALWERLREEGRIEFANDIVRIEAEMP